MKALGMILPATLFLHVATAAEEKPITLNPFEVSPAYNEASLAKAIEHAAR